MTRQQGNQNLSSASHIVKFVSRFTCCEYVRRNLAHSEWNVPICKELVRDFPMILVRRSRISLAALLVNVTAHIEEGGSLCETIKCTMREMRTWLILVADPRRRKILTNFRFSTPRTSQYLQGNGWVKLHSYHQRHKNGVQKSRTDSVITFELLGIQASQNVFNINSGGRICVEVWSSHLV